MSKRNLDFVEIGTADFDTLIQDCSDLAQGISIEPLDFYLDALPSKPHVIKLQKAVSNTTGLTEIYYLDPKVLGDKVPSTGWWIRGCSCIAKPHPTLIEYCNLWGIPLSAIIKCEVEKITFEQIVAEYEIEQINFLKIDTEGHDCVIMHDVLDVSKREGKIYAQNIRFETNKLSEKKDVEDVIRKAQALGYFVHRLPMFGETFLTTNSKLNSNLHRSLNEPTMLEAIKSAMSC